MKEFLLKIFKILKNDLMVCLISSVAITTFFFLPSHKPEDWDVLISPFYYIFALFAFMSLPFLAIHLFDYLLGSIKSYNKETEAIKYIVITPDGKIGNHLGNTRGEVMFASMGRYRYGYFIGRAKVRLIGA